jgi:ketosteroid isomerase-like protein
VFEMMMKDKIDSSAFEYWLRAYGQAWEAGDPDAVAALFTADASYHETPFDEPMVGTEAIHRYWSEGAEQAQKNVQFSFIILSIGRPNGHRAMVCLVRANPVRRAGGTGWHPDG